jgi:hypothetical protein
MADDDRVIIVELADDLQVRKQRLFKVMARLGIRSVLRRESARLGRTVATVTQAEALRIREVLARPAQAPASSAPVELGAWPAGDEIGVFYLIQLEPEHDPGRFKLGFTAELEGRLRKHRTSAPFARAVKTWPCRRAWERAAIDSASDGCDPLHTEVFRTESIDTVGARANAFFAAMPSCSKPGVGEKAG